MLKDIRFKSCFICEVIISDASIELVDAGHSSFYIDKSDEALMKEFKDWFVNVYKACIPQTLTVVQYEIADNSGEPVMQVVKLLYKKSASCEMLNETKKNGESAL